MTGKRFTNIEHDYENAWIKCLDDGDFMIYAIYKELDESLPSLEDLLNGLADENKELQYKLRSCIDARQSYKQDWKACSSYCDEYKNKIISLEDEVEGLIEENKGLHEKNQLLNEKEKDMLNYLKNEYDYVYNQRMKHLDDTVLVNCYEMIEYYIKSMIEHLEGL